MENRRACEHDPYDVPGARLYEEGVYPNPGRTHLLQKCRKCGLVRVIIFTDNDPHCDVKPWHEPQ